MKLTTVPDHSLKSIQVDTTPFRTSHGRLPRGRGRWAFSLGGSEIIRYGMYAQAKKDAIHLAQTKGIRIVKVLG